MKPSEALRKKIKSKSARVAVIGLGYVGLPLAVAFARRGFRTVGIDLSRTRVRRANAGDSYIDDVSSNDLKHIIKKGLFKAVIDFFKLRVP